jgi:chaperonin GroES
MTDKVPFRPPHDVVICRKQSREEKRDSGLVVPEFAEARPDALVLAAGEGQLQHDGTRLPMHVRVGDTVIFPETRGQKFSYHGIEYLAIREGHCIALVDAAGELVPLADFVIAEQLPTERVNDGGVIVIPSTADDRDEATLLAVGPGRIRDDGARAEPQLRAGERVLYMKRQGDHFTHKGRALVAFREEHVVCVTADAPVAEAVAA